MPNSSRKYPDISFVDKDTERLANNLIASYEIFAGRKLFPADPARLFILWIADIIMQERVIIDASAKQNVPRYAEGEFLDSLAEIFKDTDRIQAQPASVTFRFHISAPQASAVTIPQGTRVTVNGEITFETTEAVFVPPGELAADAPAICQTAGEVGNKFIPGQITQLVDVFPFFDRVENITTSEGGANTETDEAFYVRLSESMEAFSTAGALGAYVYWAKTASAKIIDVKPTSPEPGVADVRILLEGGEMPDVEMIQRVRDKLNEDKTRPFTDFVQVGAPDPVPYDLDLTYYIPSPRANSAALIQTEVAAAVEEYKRWQSGKMGRDINPDMLIQLLRTAGAKRAEIRSPAFAVVEDTAVAVLDNEAVVYGGVEDE
jgi:phage-related baseplate assembly protein